MGIPGINNRTENWKTAPTFAPFIGNQFAAKLPAERRLIGGGYRTSPLVHEEEVSLELFWTGGGIIGGIRPRVTQAPKTGRRLCRPLP